MDTTCKICNHNFKIVVENLEGVLSRCPRCGSVQQFPAQTDDIKSEDDRTKIFENNKDGRVLGGKISIINKEGGIYLCCKRITLPDPETGLPLERSINMSDFSLPLWKFYKE